MYKNILILASAVTSTALASQTTVAHRVYSPNQCAYFSTLLSDFQVRYQNQAVANPVHVAFVYGFKWAHGTEIDDWSQTKQVAMQASGEGQWDISLTEQTAYRSGGAAQAIQFVFRIEMSDGTVFYDKGNQSLMGYYEGALAQSLECTPGAFSSLYLISVEK